MYSQIVSVAFCFIVLLTCSREESIDSTSASEGSESEKSSSPTNGADSLSDQRSRARTNFEDTGKDLEEGGSPERGNHSRMLKTSTTLGYDEWWFLTTSRPFISYKDFPGRPGVASWKEISPNSSTETRKSRKMNTPTAAEVTSSSWRPFPHMGHIVSIGLLWIALSQSISHWNEVLR